MQIHSKLPQVGTTIFSVMSALANEYKAINLSQGFPNYPCDPKLIDLVYKYMKTGMNQYAPMPGFLPLNQILSQKVQNLYHAEYNPHTEITICPGATEAIFSTILAFIHPGDEVVVIEPAYDSYIPAILLAGGTPLTYALSGPDWKMDWSELENRISDRTKMIIVNTPHNPLGTIFSDEDMKSLSKIVLKHDLLVLSDEVYEHLILNESEKHHSVLKYPELRSRSLAVYSFGKTLHATGWKLGYVVADEKLMFEFRKVHQFNVFSVNTPMQAAIAEYLEDETVYLNLPSFFQKKRDLFLDLTKNSSFQMTPSAGTYFQIADYSEISEEADIDFTKRITKEFGIATIPLSSFYSTKINQKYIRFCFAKTDETLEAAAEKINTIL